MLNKLKIWIDFKSLDIRRSCKVSGACLTHIMSNQGPKNVGYILDALVPPRNPLHHLVSPNNKYIIPKSYDYATDLSGK